MSTTTTRPIERVLARLPEAKPHGHWYNTLCPAHQDQDMSFGFTESKTGGVHFHCFAGCSREQILAALHLTEDEVRGDGRTTRPDRRITLWDLAVEKCLHPSYLLSYGLIDGYTWRTSKGKTVEQVIRIPYYLENGEEHTLAHIRFNLTAKGGTGADGTGSLIPYGLNRLADARSAGSLVIVEGESDCWTLWRFGFPALGIPGATNAKTLHADLLKGIERVYICQELTDNAGRAFPSHVARRLAETGYAGQCFALPLLSTHDVKDPNALLQRLYREQRIDAFPQEMQKALETATPIELQTDTSQALATLESLQPLVFDAIEKQDVAALYDLAGQIAALETKERALLTAAIQSGMQKCKGFSWIAFKKLLQEAQTTMKRAQARDRAYVSGRPQVLLGRQLREEGDDALSALSKANTPPEIYVRGGKLARVRLDEKASPIIEAMTDTMIIVRLTQIRSEEHT